METLITLVTYSHTDYQDVWPIVLGQLKKQTMPFSRIFACNETDVDLSAVRNIYTDVVFYKDTLTYPQKILSILEQVTTPYVLFVHDIDVFVTFETEKFAVLLNSILKYSIDRCMLGMVIRQGDVLGNGEVVLTNVSMPNRSPSYVTPYDVGPSI